MASEIKQNELINIRIAGAVRESIVDGPGIRYTLFVQGCPHCCGGCHNQKTQDFGGGYDKKINEIVEDILQSKLSSVTFSGGEPFCQAAELALIAKKVRLKRKVSLIVYTGFKLEELMASAKQDKGIRDLLAAADYIIDGRFEEDKHDVELLFRGSSNQRIFDVTCYPNSSLVREITNF